MTHVLINETKVGTLHKRNDKNLKENRKSLET